MRSKRVLISGVGIAGPTLAFWLRAAKFEPTLVERAAAPRAAGYVIDFWGLGYEIADRMGLAGEIERVGYSMQEMRIVGDQGRRLSGFGTRVMRELTGGRFVTLARADLSRLLFERLAGATEVVFGDEIVALQEDAKCVHVGFKHGGSRDYDIVIGADGLHSNVRGLVFGRQETFETSLGYIAAAFEVRGYRPRDENVYVTYGEPGRMIARFALHDDRTLFLFVFAAPAGVSTAKLELEEQKAILRERYGAGKWECPRILDELDRTNELYFDRVSQIRMDRWSRGRVALVGDAAFCVSLMAGQGSSLAMTAAYVLAGELASSGGEHDEAFGRYEALMRPFIASKQEGARRFAVAFAPMTRWGMIARNQVAKAFAIPGLARFVFGREIVDTLQLPEYSELSSREVARRF